MHRSKRTSEVANVGSVYQSTSKPKQHLQLSPPFPAASTLTSTITPHRCSSYVSLKQQSKDPRYSAQKSTAHNNPSSGTCRSRGARGTGSSRGRTTGGESGGGGICGGRGSSVSGGGGGGFGSSVGGGRAIGLGRVAVLGFLLLDAEFTRVAGAVAVAGQDIGVLVTEATVVVGRAGFELGPGGGKAGIEDVLGSTAASPCSSGSGAGARGRGLSSSKAGSSQNDGSSRETHLVY